MHLNFLRRRGGGRYLSSFGRSPVRVVGESSGRPLTLELGRIAPLTDAAVFASLGGTSVLATVVASRFPSEENSLPLSVDFRERAFAFGEIPGSSSRKEGGASEREILVSRVIDRSLRPLFPAGFFYDTQLSVSVLSAERDADTVTLSVLAASAALHAGPVPFSEPAAAVRMGWVGGAPLLSPAPGLLPGAGAGGRLDLLYAGAAGSRTLMLEIGAAELPEAELVMALRAADAALDPLLQMQHELRHAWLLADERRASKRPYALFVPPDDATATARAAVWEETLSTFSVPHDTKVARSRAQTRLISAARTAVTAAHPTLDARLIKIAADDAVRDAMRAVTERAAAAENGATLRAISRTISHAGSAEPTSPSPSALKFFDALEPGARVDGRSTVAVRELRCEVAVVPRVHGSALFSRGDTQVLAVATVGPLDMSLESVGATHAELPPPRVVPADASTDAESPSVAATGGGAAAAKRFFLHYDFPPYATNEIGKLGGPNRRMIGHGALAERALSAVFPDAAAFPYATRVVAETTASDGSSSMASVCAGYLALADAGVPLTAAVAGVSMGSIIGSPVGGDGEGGGALPVTLLTDILGHEDHAGDMDFKIAGTAVGVTAAQLDVKPAGVPLALLEAALPRALAARLHILAALKKELPAPRPQLGPLAPHVTTLVLPAELRSKLVGPGGSNLRRVESLSGARVVLDADAHGNMNVYGSVDALAAATALINASVSEQLRSSRNPLSSDLQSLFKWPRLTVGVPVRARVARINEFGAVLETDDSAAAVGSAQELGWLHVSDIVARGRLAKVSDALTEGDVLTVQTCDIDARGRGRFSLKALVKPEEDHTAYIERRATSRASATAESQPLSGALTETAAAVAAQAPVSTFDGGASLSSASAVVATSTATSTPPPTTTSASTSTTATSATAPFPFNNVNAESVVDLLNSIASTSMRALSLLRNRVPGERPSERASRDPSFAHHRDFNRDSRSGGRADARDSFVLGRDAMTGAPRSPPLRDDRRPQQQASPRSERRPHNGQNHHANGHNNSVRSEGRGGAFVPRLPSPTTLARSTPSASSGSTVMSAPAPQTEAQSPPPAAPADSTPSLTEVTVLSEEKGFSSASTATTGTGSTGGSTEPKASATAGAEVTTENGGIGGSSPTLKNGKSKNSAAKRKKASAAASASASVDAAAHAAESSTATTASTAQTIPPTPAKTKASRKKTKKGAAAANADADT